MMALPPAAVDRLGLLVAGAGMDRPLAETGREGAQKLSVAVRLAVGIRWRIRLDWVAPHAAVVWAVRKCSQVSLPVGAPRVRLAPER